MLAGGRGEDKMNFDKEDFKAYLTMIQSIISRMANNSFLVKGWAMTIISAILALAASRGLDNDIYIVAAIVTIAFCFLNCIYLRTERLYRNLYKKVQNEGMEDLKQVKYFNLDTSECKDKNTRLIRVIMSNSIWPFYSAILLGVLITAV